MTERGHTVFVYGTDEYDHQATQVYCYDETEPPEFTPQAWEPFNAAAADSIRRQLQPNDFICLIGGTAQASLLSLPAQTCEFGIGYGGSIQHHPRVFESYAWMHTTYGAENRSNNDADGNFYDTVIPASFDPDEFSYETQKDDYLLYVGRLTERKGIQIACETAERLGCDLLLAGEGDYEPTYGQMLGKVGPDDRAALMSRARALIAPTTYLEPFGFVAVEAMLSGTPAITTDWGAFTETVQHGTSGYRCRTLGEFAWAVENADRLDPAAIRDYAIANYSYGAVMPRYETYFDQLNTLQGNGWYADWEGLSACHRYGPQPTLIGHGTK